jgi:hypothetical protein
MVHEKSAGHRRMLANTPDDPMSKEDDVFKIPLMILLMRKLMIPILIIPVQH